MRAIGLCLVISAAGCISNTPPAAIPLPESYAVAGSVDEAWAMLAARLVERGFTLTTSDRAGGVIATDWKELRDDAKTAEYMRCGQNALGKEIKAGPELSPWARVQALVPTAAAGNARVRIRPALQLWYGVTSPGSPQGFTAVAECVSTGVLEQELVSP